MTAGEPHRGKTKFAEEFIVPFVTLYSFSTTQEIADNQELDTMKDPAILFADLRRRVDNNREGEELEIVNGLTGRELVIAGAKFQIGKHPRIDSECALIVWYKTENDHQKPLNSAGRSYYAFELLQQKLTPWLDTRSRTKTALVYD